VEESDDVLIIEEEKCSGGSIEQEIEVRAK
jgi:hypothetical protein